MSQHHFKDDPLMGNAYEIDGHTWEVVDVWVDIGQPEDAPRNVTLDRTDGDDFGLHMTAMQLASYARLY